MMKKTSKIIVLDFFGVISSEVSPVWFKKYSKSEDWLEEKKKAVFPVDSGDITTRELFSDLSESTGRSSQDIEDEWFSLVGINQELISFIKNNQDNFYFSIASNAGADFLRQILEDNDLESLFDKVIISSDLLITKPRKEFFEKMLEILEVDKGQIIFFDDNQENVDAANDFGIESYKFESTNKLAQIVNSK